MEDRRLSEKNLLTLLKEDHSGLRNTFNVVDVIDIGDDDGDLKEDEIELFEEAIVEAMQRLEVPFLTLREQ
jgi:hypothetical protein